MVKSVTVRAPCSTANLGPGFDVFGMALDVLYDKVILTKKGKIILSDDDSGGNYNFAIDQKLPPGDYILSVKHCCFGKGPFSLTFE